MSRTRVLVAAIPRSGSQYLLRMLAGLEHGGVFPKHPSCRPITTIAAGVFESCARFFQTHDFAPPELPDDIRVVFTFADPLDSLLSFIGNRWGKLSLLNCHCQDPANANPIERDDPNFERMFDTWTAPGKTYPVLAVR